MKRAVLPVLILVASVAAAVILIRTPTQIEEASPEAQPVAIRVMEAQRTSVQLAVHSQGKVQAAQQVDLSAPVAGQITWVSPSLEPGGFLAQGQPILRIDPSDYETVLARSQASLVQTQAEADYAEDDLQRIDNLASQGLASQAQLQDAQRSHAVAVARQADAEASVAQAELDLQRTELIAPFDAVVASKAVELGQFVNRAQNISVLYGANEVEVRVPLAIRQLGYLDVPLGWRGELNAEQAPGVRLTGMYGGEQHHWSGKLVRVEAAIDESSNAVQTIIRVDQPDQAVGSQKVNRIPLPIGLYVQANISGRVVDSVIALPRNVIRNNNQVLVIDGENKMYFREVEIYRLEEDRVLIAGGLEPGELICISPIQAVYDGMAVQPVREII